MTTRNTYAGPHHRVLTWSPTIRDRLSCCHNRQVPEYSHLQVNNADLAREFPFTADAPTPSRVSGPGAKERGIEMAVQALWKGQIPIGLTAKDRNKAIVAWLSKSGCSVPSSPERAIQRALKKLEKGTP